MQDGELTQKLSRLIIMLTSDSTQLRTAVYLDTNAWSSLAKKTKSITPLIKWLESNPQFFVSISRFQIGELIKDTRLAQSVVEVIKQLPVIFIDRGTNDISGVKWNKVKYEKIMPFSPIPDGSINYFIDFFKNQSIKDSIMNTKSDADSWQNLLVNSLDQVPPGRNRSWNEFPSFIKSWIINRCKINGINYEIQWISDPNRYIGLKLCAGVMFFRYYINRSSFKDSDYLDFLHASDMAYAHLVVTERNLCECIKQIKKRLPSNGPDKVENLDWLDSPE